MKKNTAFLLLGIILIALVGGTAVLVNTALKPDGRGQTEDGNSPAQRSEAPSRLPTNKGNPIHLPRLDAAGPRFLDTDPGGILSAHESGNRTSWSHTDEDLLVAWAARNPEAAMQWVDSGDHRVVRSQLLGAVATGILIRQGPGAMQAFLAKHQEDPRYWADWAEQRQSDLLPQIMQAWARNQPAEARTWIEQHFTPGTSPYARVMELME